LHCPVRGGHEPELSQSTTWGWERKKV